MISRLRNFNDWRTGKVDETMEDAGVVPAQVTADIYAICDHAELSDKTIKKLKSQIQEYEEKLKKHRIMP